MRSRYVEPPPILSFTGKYRFLSNFYSYPFVAYDYVLRREIKVESVEHGYQSRKTTDPFERLNILQADTPALAKKLGARCKLRPEWETIKLPTMRSLLWTKFNDTLLTKRLVDTWPAHLEEGNWWGDVFWGTCHGEGENQLGRILMDIRSKLMG